MWSSFGHLQINVSKAALPFYKDLMMFLGWKVIFADATMAGFQGEGNGSLWFISKKDASQTDYDQLGVNHIAIGVTKQKDVDDVVAFLKEKQIESLFDTPRRRKDFATDEANTYYQVMFTSPDNILFEVVYSGPKETA